MSRSIPSPKDSGEAVEADLIQRLDALEPEVSVEWVDARVDGVLEPSEALPFYSIAVLEDGTPVEIKSAQIRLTSGARGRYFIRRRQHETLVDRGGSYLLGVYEPRPGHPIRAAAVVPASIVDELRPEEWIDVDADRSETGYNQLAWSNVLDPDRVEDGRSRL